MNDVTHAVFGTSLNGEWPPGSHHAIFGMGCFWGAERLYWTLPGVFSTAAGYSGGTTDSPTYPQVCSGRTGHAEVVRVVYDPSKISFEELLKVFWENHDPTQGDRQGNDIGSQYRSAIFATSDEQLATAEISREAFAPVVATAGYGPITTQISRAGNFYLAEPEHQQYLHHNPGGYCNHGPNGLSCPIGIVRQDQLPSQQDIAPPA
jgi:peptide-methionine (S)-S-oxide reductase